MANKKLFMKNAFSGMIQKVLIAILTFFTIPVFIFKLGPEAYGIFATVSVIGDLSRIANIGFHIALIKYLSIQGKTKESAIDIVVAFTGMVAIIVPVSVLMIIFNKFVLVNVLNVSALNLAQSKMLYIYLVLANMLLFIGLTFSAMLESLKMIYKVNLFQLIYSITYWSLMLIVLWMGKGLEAIGLMAFVAALIWFILIVTMAFNAWGKLSINGIRILYWKSVKKQLTYGLQLYASGLMGLFGEPVIKVLVANIFGHAYVGFLDIGLRIRNQVGRVFDAAMWPLFQLFSEMREDASKSRIVKDIQEKTALIILPVCFMILFGAKSLVTLWIGNNIDIISMNIIIVTVGSLISFLVFSPMNHYLGVDHPMILFVNSAISNIIYLGTVYFTHKFFGYNSVYLCFALAYIVNVGIMIYSQRKYLNSGIFDSMAEISRLGLYLVIMILVGWLLSYIKYPIIHLATLAIVIPVLSLLIYIFISLINKNDIDRYFLGKPIARPIYILIEYRNKLFLNKQS